MALKVHPIRLTAYLDEEMGNLFEAWIEQTAFRNTSASHALRCILATYLGMGSDQSTPGFGAAWQNGCVDPRQATTTSEGQDAPATGSRRSHLRLV